jgi:hypothetical protein
MKPIDINAFTTFETDMGVDRMIFDFEQKKLKNFKDKVEFYSATEGWFYDSVDQNRVVLIKTKKLAVSNKFEVKLVF